MALTDAAKSLGQILRKLKKATAFFTNSYTIKKAAIIRKNHWQA